MFPTENYFFASKQSPLPPRTMVLESSGLLSVGPMRPLRRHLRACARSPVHDADFISAATAQAQQRNTGANLCVCCKVQLWDNAQLRGAELLAGRPLLVQPRSGCCRAGPGGSGTAHLSVCVPTARVRESTAGQKNIITE